jgi:signal transduction histidine kinase
LEQTKFEKKKKDEQIYLLQSLQTLDENELINLQHHIGLYAHDIEGMLISFKRRYNKSKTLDENNVFKLIDRLTLSNKKILAINKLVTKKGFLNDSEEKEGDLIRFIYEYIHDIYIVDDSKINIQINTYNVKYETIYSPFEFSIILDNLIQNAKKINKDRKILITINITINNGFLEIEFYDNGKGLDENIKNPFNIFEQGFTTSNGSGLGLYHVKDILNKYYFDICVDIEYKDGFKLLITSQKKVLE